MQRHLPFNVDFCALKATNCAGLVKSFLALILTSVMTCSAKAAENSSAVSPAYPSSATSPTTSVSITSLDRMTIALAENYPPFSWMNSSQTIEGILKDFLHELLETRMGINVTYNIYPWARGQKLVEDGIADAFFTIPNSNRQLYTEITKTPIFSSDYFMYTSKFNPNLELLRNTHTLTDLKALSNLTHAYIVGAGWHGENLGDLPNIWIEQDSKHILALLQFNRADVYIEQRPLMNFQIKMFGYKGEIIEIPNKMDTTPWHLCISKKSPFTMILPELNELLENLDSTGELESLREKIFSQYQ